MLIWEKVILQTIGCHYFCRKRKMDLSELRKEYKNASLAPEDMLAHPIAQFDAWFKEAQTAEILEPNAMSLATATKDAFPSIRTVLLKYFDENGFVFYTNYQSRKAKEIAENPKASLLFTWLPLQRQVRIKGSVEKVSALESMKYFQKRPRESQIGAWVSQQSEVISSRQLLLNQFEKMKARFKNGAIPLPEAWGGYRVIPQQIEFWQGRESRLHDRVLYTKDTQQWKMNLLAP